MPSLIFPDFGVSLWRSRRSAGGLTSGLSDERRGGLPSRPHPFSSMPLKGDTKAVMAGYTSWESLTDRNWFSRYFRPGRCRNIPT